MIDKELQENLGELINIAFGSATATIADIFDNFATLHVPNLSFIALEELDDFIIKDFNSNDIYTTTQQFKGLFQGEIIFAMDPDSARNMQRVLFADNGMGDTEILSDNELKQSIMEISNILGSSCIGKLAELLDTEVTFAPPSIEFSQKLMKNGEESPYHHVIVISTVLEFREIQLRGELFILFSDEICRWLETALENYLENI